jgi:hypothetical protein
MGATGAAVPVAATGAAVDVAMGATGAPVSTGTGAAIGGATGTGAVVDGTMTATGDPVPSPPQGRENSEPAMRIDLSPLINTTTKQMQV